MGPRLRAMPLAPFERDGLRAALKKTGLPTDDIDERDLLFWRFETRDDVPVGFGGLEIHDKDALLRSLVVLPPLRRIGFGAAIVAALELEARVLGCRAIYLLTPDPALFARLGYRDCKRNELPDAITSNKQFAQSYPANAATMTKGIV